MHEDAQCAMHDAPAPASVTGGSSGGGGADGGSGCEGCAQPCASGGVNGSSPTEIEDMADELAALERRREEIKRKLSQAKGGGANGTSSSSPPPPPSTSAPSSSSSSPPRPRLRSRDWFQNPSNPAMTALYVERYLNYGLTRSELMAGKPIVGIAQSGSDISPCNRHHLQLARRVADGIRSAGGIPLEFPQHPVQESSRRPSAMLDRNLLYLTLVETLFAYPFDGVVLLTGCDKTTPACVMAAATVNIPAVCLNVGPMLSGHADRSCELVGAGTVVWKGRELHATGQLDDDQLVDYLAQGTPSVGHCNTMGTASTMNAIAEALGMALPGSSAIPAPYRRRAQCAYETGEAIVEMVRADRRPSAILTREAFENAIIVNTAIGGSSNAPIHLNAMARHAGVPLTLDDWDRIGYGVPCLVNMQPAGEKLGEEYFRAGGLPAVIAELRARKLLHEDALACNGRTLAENNAGVPLSWDRETILPYDRPLRENAGFLHLSGNLFDSGIMKTSVISDAFRARYLSDPAGPDTFEGKAAVFDGPEGFHARITDEAWAEAHIDGQTIMVMRGAGPIGYPGAAEVVNMHPPPHLLRRGITTLPTIGDGRQSGTSYAPSILNVSPEAAAGGNLAIVEDGDRIRVDLGARTVHLLLDQPTIDARWHALRRKNGPRGYPIPDTQTPWQEIFRDVTGPLSEGMVTGRPERFQRITDRWMVPRHNH